MTEQEWGFTPPGSDRVPYLNVKKLYDGSFQVTVRSPGKGDGTYGDTGAITLSAEDFASFIKPIGEAVT